MTIYTDGRGSGRGILTRSVRRMLRERGAVGFAYAMAEKDLIDALMMLYGEDYDRTAIKRRLSRMASTQTDRIHRADGLIWLRP